MSEFIPLVHIDTPDFSAWVPPMTALPASKMLSLVTTADNPAKQIATLIEILNENLAPELVESFNQLNIDQVAAVAGAWVEASTSK